MSKLTKNTVLAFVNTKTDEVETILAQGPTAINEVLNANVRAESQYGMNASHVTNTTRKYQCNAALCYANAVAKVRDLNDFTTDGAAIRLILEAGLKALGFTKLVEEVEAERAAADGEEA